LQAFSEAPRYHHSDTCLRFRFTIGSLFVSLLSLNTKQGTFVKIFGIAALLAGGVSWSSCEESKNDKKGRFLLICIPHAAFPETHSGLKIFTGNSNRALAQDVANQLGVSLGKITVNKFADGEVNVMVNENVRGKDVYIIQPTSPPVNETLMELLLMISTMRRASARKITAVIPYYGYARQDRKMQARVPISAADVARLLEAMVSDQSC
jgi:hypothetical protein